MNRYDRIEHEGVVADISETHICVEILSKSACAACHAREVCAAGDSRTRLVEIPLSVSVLASDYKVGDKVNLILSPSLGTSAVWLAYVAPLGVLLASIAGLSLAGLDELYVGLCSIGAVALYYAVLSLFRSRLSRIFTFSVEPLQNRL